MNKTGKNVHIKHVLTYTHIQAHMHMIENTEVIKVYSVAHGQNDRNNKYLAKNAHIW